MFKCHHFKILCTIWTSHDSSPHPAFLCLRQPVQFQPAYFLIPDSWRHRDLWPFGYWKRITSFFQAKWKFVTNLKRLHRDALETPRSLDRGGGATQKHNGCHLHKVHSMQTRWDGWLVPFRGRIHKNWVEFTSHPQNETWWWRCNFRVCVCLCRSLR